MMTRYYVRDGFLLLPAYDAARDAPEYILPARSFRLREDNGQPLQAKGLQETSGEMVKGKHQWGEWRLVIGQTTLVEYLIEDAPSAESEWYVDGWKRGFNGKRSVGTREFEKHSVEWQEGYRVGLGERQGLR